MEVKGVNENAKVKGREQRAKVKGENKSAKVKVFIKNSKNSKMPRFVLGITWISELQIFGNPLFK